MRRSFFVIGVLAVFLLVSACSVQPAANVSPGGPASIAAAAVEATPALDAQPPQETGMADLTRTDEQGAVVVVVIPLNLDSPDQTLDFEVTMNTHSVDLGMDLAPLATLTTDSGKSIPAASWTAPGGGHHVAGTLSFPAVEAGSTLLDGVKTVTVTITNVDAPERVFEWTLP